MVLDSLIIRTWLDCEGSVDAARLVSDPYIGGAESSSRTEVDRPSIHVSQRAQLYMEKKTIA